MPSLSRATVRWKLAGKNLSSAPETTLIGTCGQAPKSQADAKAASDSGRWYCSPDGRDLGRHVVQEVCLQVDLVV